MAFRFKVMARRPSQARPATHRFSGQSGSSSNLPPPKFGGGVGLCGACGVRMDGKRAAFCQAHISEAAGREATTLKGLSADSSHPVRKACLAERSSQ
jgi:aerobic-type carbon monoxide dehydrogenase small subunit (CoxS/CutS family)